MIGEKPTHPVMQALPEQTPTSKALILIYQLVEQVNGAGFFKQLVQLDQIREAFSVITTELQTLNENIQTLTHELEQERAKTTSR